MTVVKAMSSTCVAGINQGSDVGIRMASKPRYLFAADIGPDSLKYPDKSTARYRSGCLMYSTEHQLAVPAAFNLSIGMQAL